MSCSGQPAPASSPERLPEAHTAFGILVIVPTDATNDVSDRFYNAFAHAACRVCVTVANSEAMIGMNDRFYGVFAHTACRICVTVANSDAMIDVND